jgi:hypothetical protein
MLVCCKINHKSRQKVAHKEKSHRDYLKQPQKIFGLTKITFVVEAYRFLRTPQFGQNTDV